MPPLKTYKRRFRVLGKLVIAGVIVFAAIGAVVGSARFDRRNGALQIDVEANPAQLQFVAGGGLGEKIHLQIDVSTFGSNGHRVDNHKQFSFDAEPSLFRIFAKTPDGEIEVKPTDFSFGACRVNSAGAKWSYVADIPLGTFVRDAQRPPKSVTLRVQMAGEFAALFAEPQSGSKAAAEPLDVPLDAQPFEKAGFTDRLHSLSAGMSISDVHRILGKPFADHPVDTKLIEYYPSYSRQIDYRNPDYKAYATSSVKMNKDVVELFFDANGRLIAYAELIYGC